MATWQDFPAFPDLPSLKPEERQALGAWYYQLRQAIQQGIGKAATSTTSSTTMATTERTLGQLSPAARTLKTMYAVPLRKKVSGGRLIIANRGAASTTFRVSVAVGGAADEARQYVNYNTPLLVGETKEADLNLLLEAGDQIRVYSASGEVSFNLMGKEADA